MGGPREYIFGGTTQLKPHFKSGPRLWVGVYLDHHVHVFEKKAILPRRNKHYFWNVSKSLVYIAEASSEIQRLVLQRSHAKTPAIWWSISGKFRDPLGENIDFRFSYTPTFMVSSMIFQNFSGEGLTVPPPQTPFPAQSQASPSILGRFAPSVRAAPSIHPANMCKYPLSQQRGTRSNTVFPKPQLPGYTIGPNISFKDYVVGLILKYTSDNILNWRQAGRIFWKFSVMNASYWNIQYSE